MKKLFYYLALLNMIDAFVTSYGLENGLISELNPFMDKLYQMNSSLFFFMKFSLSFCLYLFIFFKVVPSSRVVKGVTFVASGMYTIVFGLHCFWLFLFLL
ncbi:DUF5658 family protein [Mesobacillus maritimus]|uniref:DUF5658 domain-containing protein n=1 Tax=Mesobacillus maritimus TaxID=1643336 RepID=A0ABS7K7M4_9BACI|nr:DUF5658 family protein [Mesobacillus maritimus]MBY0098263.1 hypothetical protein [Mesobacillus maritimus]